MIQYTYWFRVDENEYKRVEANASDRLRWMIVVVIEYINELNTYYVMTWGRNDTI
jgi:hypothetical protein